MPKYPHLGKDKKRVLSVQYLVIAAMIFIAVSTALYGYGIARRYQEHGQLHAIELSVGALIRADVVQRMDGENDAYLHIKESLYEIIKHNDQVNAVLLFTRRGDDGQIVLLADSGETQSPGYHISADIVSSVEQSFSEEKMVMTTPRSIGENTRLRSFVPIIDYDTGKAVAVLGIDFDTAFGRQNTNMIHIIVFSACVLLLGLGIYYAGLKNKMLRNIGEKLQSSESPVQDCL